MLSLQEKGTHSPRVQDKSEELSQVEITTDDTSAGRRYSGGKRHSGGRSLILIHTGREQSKANSNHSKGARSGPESDATYKELWPEASAPPIKTRVRLRT